MKYGESAFDILYLLFAITGGRMILRRAGDKTEKFMGLAALILGCGDAFHLIPRVMNYFSDADFTAALGIGKLITSISMTVFYLLLYKIWLGHYRMRENQSFTSILRALLIIRVILCLLPQNRWFDGGDQQWGIIRNIPFLAILSALKSVMSSSSKVMEPLVIL